MGWIRIVGRMLLRLPFAILAGTVGFAIGFFSRSTKVALTRDEEDQLFSLHTTRQLETIVDSCDEAILSKDTDLRILSWNHAAERMFGYKASEAIGQSVRFIIPENRIGEEQQMMERIQHSGNAERFESERRRRDGTI